MSYDLFFFFFQTFLSESFIAFITSVLNIVKLKLKKTPQKHCCWANPRPEKLGF